jgi:hypothetical protein
MPKAVMPEPVMPKPIMPERVMPDPAVSDAAPRSDPGRQTERARRIGLIRGGHGIGFAQ